MDPKILIGPDNPLGYPAPYWFLVLFKVLGFTLHMVPMGLWYAGIVLVLLMRWRGGEHSKRLSARLMKQMPILVALGVNFGIVPLLFMQVAYYKVFYPATILMAWPWFSIIIMLTLAYYGVYIYVVGLRDDGARMTTFKQVAGWVSAVLFIVIGFLFASAMSLMTNLDAWPSLWQNTSVAGAPLGVAYHADASLWPRWLMMFGLALTTTAAYMIVDTGFFAGKEDEEYKGWVPSLALKICAVGIVWFAITGLWYVFGTWPAELRQRMFGGSLTILTILTAIGPGLTLLLIIFQRKGVTRTLALITGLVQFLVLGLNAISRQIVQNAELGKFLDVTAEQVKTQWSPMIIFLLLFVAGLLVVIWMITKIVNAEEQPAETA